MNSGRWFYFIRHGSRMQLRASKTVPKRPLDAQPDNGDPLTPWYEVQDHFDDTHVHVYALSEDDAVRKAMILVGNPLASGWKRSSHHPNRNPDPFDIKSVIDSGAENEC